MTDDSITALEYLEKQERLEKEACEILPGKFEKCSFPLGYVRQSLYACKTCGDDQAGICYSCSIACHADHELFELFPKRAFRCDCGMEGKLNEHACSLMLPAKRIVKKNEKNKYNHNFQGLYCRCNEYYDPEKEEDVMFQCSTCEDWFHERCIGNFPEEISDFESYICRECTNKYTFLMNGKNEKFSFGLSKGNDVVSTWILPKLSVVPESGHNEKTEKEQAVEIEIKAKDDEKLDNEQIGEKRKAPNQIERTDTKKLKGDGCTNVDVSSLPEHDNKEIFLQEGWRDGLCKCQNCMNSYRDSGLEWLLIEEKTHEPEEDEDAGKSLFEIGMEQLQRVDRVKALESLMAYKTLSEDIKNYFKSFESGKVITKEDIERYFKAKRQEENK
ncbi:hypothetical protein K501DRAFT_263530 [Backusella circina FSU 941]|nr:hypothetical protein K501DRAFT_263530 [Backusella circina FSU 941]